MNTHRALRILLLGATATLLCSCGDRRDSTPPTTDAKPITAAELPATTPADLLTREPDTVVARVDGTEFTLAEANAEIDKRINIARHRNPNLDTAKARGELLTRIIDQFVVKRLLLDEADRRGITISEEEKQTALEMIQKRLSSAPGAENAPNIPETTEDLPTEVLSSMLVKKLMAQVLPPDPEVTEAEITAFLEKNPNTKMPESVSAHHILIRVAATATEQQKAEKLAKIQALREELVAGADFSELATSSSDCPSSQRGGDLGTFRRGFMEKAFEDAAFSQEAGEIGQVVETKFGYHIIRVDEHYEAGDVPRELIAKQLKQQKSKVAHDQFLISLRKKADVSFPATEW